MNTINPATINPAPTFHPPRRPHAAVRRSAIRPWAASLLLLSSVALGATFTDRTHGFSVTPPAGWTRGSDPQAAALFSAPASANGTVANLNVVVKTLPSAQTLNDFTSLTSSEVAQAFPGATKTGTVRLTLDGQPAATTTYTLPAKGRRLVVIQTLLLVGKRAYVLTGTTDQAGAPAFGAVNTAFLKSFRLLK